VAGKQRRGKRNRQKAAVPAKSQAKPSRSAKPQPAAQSREQRALHGLATWTGGLVTAVVAAVLAAIVTVEISPHNAAAAQTAITRHGPPVKIDSVTVLRTTGQAGTYVFQRALYLSPTELYELNQLQDGTPGYTDWFRSRGGVDPFSSNVQLVVEGNAEKAVRITNMSLLKTCRAPLSGTLFESPSAGNEPSILIDFNLDSPNSVAQTVTRQDYFSRYTISLQPGEVQVIQISALTERYYCQYEIQLDVLVGARATVETVTDDGKPFQVSAIYGSNSPYHVLYVGGVASSNGEFARENPDSTPAGG
jgi:hypothetical protein